MPGNDSDQDSDKEPAPPPKVADKPVARTGKRDASGSAPSEARGAGAGGRGRGERRGGFTGNDGGRFNPSSPRSNYGPLHSVSPVCGFVRHANISSSLP